MRAWHRTPVRRDRLLRGLRAVMLCGWGLCAVRATADVQDRWEVTLAPPRAFVMEGADVNNPLGMVTVRGWDREDVRVVAEKWASTPESMRRLRVLAGFCADGTVCVKTYVLVPEGERLSAAAPGRIDLTLHVPRRLPVKARTFVGDLEAEGMRSGAYLEARRGAVRVRDTHGPIVARTLRGHQTVTQVEGSVEVRGVAGDVELVEVRGDRLIAHTIEGNIRATRVRGELVRLSTTSGEVWLLDFEPLPAGRYELSTFDGGIRLQTVGDTATELIMKNLRGRLISPKPLTVRSRAGRVVRARLGSTTAERTASLTLTAVGDIRLE